MPPRLKLVIGLLLVGGAALFWALHEPALPVEGPADEPFTLLIAGATVLDGTGDPGRRADVGIRGDRIAAVGDLEPHPAERRIDAGGLVVAPGFINTHSHIDEWLAEGRDVTPSLAQGITTDLVGADGETPVEIDAHLNALAAAGLPMNYGTLIGQAALQRAVGVDRPESATADQLRQMAQLVEQAMAAGAFGLSTGLEYTPGRYASTDELAVLAAAAAPYGGRYVSHIRDEGAGMLAALDEALTIGRTAGVPVVISHLKVRRAPGWPDDAQVVASMVDEALAHIEAARADGREVWADLYPYRATWSGLRQGLAAALDRYPAETLIISRSTEAEWLDRSLTDLAAEWELAPGAAAQRILATDPDARVAVQAIPQSSIEGFLAAPFTMVSVDNPSPTGRWPQPGGPTHHPRSFGTYPRLLGHYVREAGLLSWAEAVHRSTGLPAAVYGIEERGLVREGYFADLVVFDPETVADRATYAHPERTPVGIAYVLVNGRLVMAAGERVLDDEGTPVEAGRVLRHGPPDLLVP